MAEWYAGLTVTDKIFFYIGIASTLFLVIQIILMFFSFGSGGEIDAGSGADINGDGSIDGDGDGSDGGLSFFSVKSFTAFFAIGSWCGMLVSSETGLTWLAILVALAAGSVALVAVGFAIKGLYKAQCSGNLVKNNLIGKTATVYVSIPERRSGRGKITIVAQGSFSEFDAVTEGERIPTDSTVKILSFEDEVFVVEKV